jgi:DNA-binding MarR family transcriptional regulator
MELSETELRMLRIVCRSMPIPVAAAALTTLLQLGRDTVSLNATSLEAKGFCIRERQGTRLFVRASAKGMDYVQRLDAPPPVMMKAPESEETDLGNRIPAVPLSDTQEDVLAALERSTMPMATSRLAELTGLTYGAAHRHALRLFRRGFLTRTREESRWLWSLTKNGREHRRGFAPRLSARVTHTRRGRDDAQS